MKLSVKITFVLIIIISISFAFVYLSKRKKRTLSAFDKVRIHYSPSIDREAKKFNLPAHYLKALIVLECSGKKPVKKRFEPFIYNQLLELKQRNLSKFERLRFHHISDANSSALKNLASSWGPFQIMGYHCIPLGIRVNDIRGKNAVYWGIVWINKTYGHYLKRKQFKDAFHIHNTGNPYPKSGRPQTYNPHYVRNGLRYMEHFRKF